MQVYFIPSDGRQATGDGYEAFAPEQALSLAERLEIHYTPKHGSWLNMAIEFSAATIQCLDRRIGSVEQPQHEIAAWEVERNQA